MFPIINHIDEIKNAIQGRDEFVIKTDVENGYQAVFYMVAFEDTFPRIDTEDTAENNRRKILRECRGILTDLKTGRVISRRYHKFFNVNEKDETRVIAIDMSQPHIILEKLDGSMITPVPTPNGLRWGTKKGITSIAGQAEKFALEHPEYITFANWCGQHSLTPIFEWCSRQQRIVIDYPVEQLILTGVRENLSGQYTLYDDMLTLGSEFSIPVVGAQRSYDGSLKDLLQDTAGLIGKEGWIIRFEDGRMYKIKANEYLLIHKTLDGLRWEKDVLYLCLTDKIDDVINKIDPKTSKQLLQFQEQVCAGLLKKSEELWWICQAEHDNLNGSKKRFALEIVSQPHMKKYSSLLFNIWDNLHNGESGAYDIIVKHVLNNLGTQTAVNGVRYLWGKASWHSVAVGDMNE